MHRVFFLVFMFGFMIGPNLTGISAAYANARAIRTLHISAAEGAIDHEFITKSLLKSDLLGVVFARFEEDNLLYITYKAPFDENRKNIVARLEELGYSVEDRG